jgi:hypothetical protein
MPIAPVNPDAIGADKLNRNRPDLHRYGAGIQQRPTAHLLYAPGAGTGKSQVASGEEALMPGLIPFYPEAVILAINCVRYGVVVGHGK